MKRTVLFASALALATPADAGKLKWLTDAADGVKVNGVSRSLPDEPWLRQPDGTYLDLAVVPDGDGTKLMGKAEDGSLVEFTLEQTEEIMGLVADGALSLPTDEEVAASEEKKNDIPDWLVGLIGIAFLAFVAWKAWNILKGIAATGKRVQGWFRKG